MVGIITRHDLTHESLQDKYLEKWKLAKERGRISKEQKRRSNHSMSINSMSVGSSRNDHGSDDMFV